MRAGCPFPALASRVLKADSDGKRFVDRIAHISGRAAAQEIANAIRDHDKLGSSMRAALSVERILRALTYAVVLFFAETASAKQPEKRIALYLEVTGADATAARARLREALPQDVVLVDTDEFRAALAAAGQTAPVGQAYGVASRRPAVLHRVHAAAVDTHADGVVVVLMYDTPKLRITRVIALLGDTESPSVDEVVKLGPAKANTDAARVRTVLTPSLEPFLQPPPVSADPTWAGATLPPAPKPPTSDHVDPAAPSAAEGPPPRNLAEVEVRVWPQAGAPNFAQARVTIGLSSVVSLVPLVGVGIVPHPLDDQAYIVGGAVRFALGKWTIEPGGVTWRFPKVVESCRGQVAIATKLGERGAQRAAWVSPRLAVAANRLLWTQHFGPPGSELWAGYTQLDVDVRPTERLLLTPSGGAFVYDRSLSKSTSHVAAVAYMLAPYPVQAWGGLKVGYALGAWMPYVAGAAWLYAADVGTGVSVTPFGLRRASGASYVDASVGVFLTDSNGPLAAFTLDVLPAFNVDVGWAF
jgi:hypothetical protein